MKGLCSVPFPSLDVVPKLLSVREALTPEYIGDSRRTSVHRSGRRVLIRHGKGSGRGTVSERGRKGRGLGVSVSVWLEGGEFVVLVGCEGSESRGRGVSSATVPLLVKGFAT